LVRGPWYWAEGYKNKENILVRKMEQNNLKKMFVVCIKNEGYTVSLELRKIYEVIPDERAADHKMIRVVDESGEDYLYPSDFFIPIDLPKPIEQALSLAL
jgi:hypothetical protein